MVLVEQILKLKLKFYEMCIKLAKISEKFLDFEVEKEIWNRYELIENAQLKARVILMKTIERKDPADPKKKPIWYRIKKYCLNHSYEKLPTVANW